MTTVRLHLALIPILCFVLMACDTGSTGSDSGKVYTIGDIGPAGGVVFYDDEADGADDIAGYRYLEVASSDYSSTVVWGTSGTSVSGTSAEIGSGQANTTAIITKLGTGGTIYAAEVANGYSEGGYDDWYLPSWKELREINQKISGTFSSTGYWSSSQNSSTESYYYNLIGGGYGPQDKSDTYKVRCIRSFN